MTVCPLGFDISNSECTNNQLCCIKTKEDDCGMDCSRKLCQRSNGKWDSDKNQNLPFICEIGISCSLSLSYITCFSSILK